MIAASNQKVRKVIEMSDNSSTSCSKHVEMINQEKKEVTSEKLGSENSKDALTNALEVTSALMWVWLIVWGEVCCLTLFAFIFVSKREFEDKCI